MPAGPKNPRRPPFRPISTESLEKVYRLIAEHYSYPGDRVQSVAKTITQHYLGREWLKFVDDPPRSANYLHVDIKEPLQQKMNALQRYWEFVETLLNLQNVEGFEVILDKLSYGTIEDTCGEIDVARLIHLHEFRFKFIRPVQKKKFDYDFEVFYPDGFKVCADAKSKFEATPLRAESIRTSLRDARKQLPDDQASMALVKVPQSWIEDFQLAREIVAVAEDYLRQSTHLVSVKFYAPVTIYDSIYTTRVHLFREVSNPKFSNRNWDMFSRRIPTFDGMPAWWTRIYPELRLPQ